MPISTFALGLINNFEWMEPNNKVEVVVGEPYQLKFNCSDNSLPFTSDYADNWNHYDFDGGQHMVSTPTGYSINEKGVITGLVPGSYAIKFTGYIQPRSGVDKMLMITVVSERSETESNNTLDTANEIYTKIRFGLYNTSDVDFFKFTNNNLKWGDNVTFKIHYYGSREEPFGYKWSTFCGTDMVSGGSLNSQDQECKALVISGNTVYLEVYYDQSRSQYFNYGEEFVVEVYINGIPASEIESGTCGDNLTWSYSKSTKTLTISGTGNMWDYDYDYFSGKSSTPWYEFSENIQNVTIHDGVTTIGNCAFYGCYNMESIDIPNSIINIGNWSFMYCRSLSNIEMPDNVVSIGAQAFYLCRGLKTIKIGNGITTIGNWAFGSCESLEFIEIPDNVKTIGGEAFRNCSKLTTVTIPKNVSSIGDMSFGFCASLSALIVEEGNSVYDSRNNCNAIIETATNELIQGCNGTTIPKGITKIKSHAFIGSGISSVTIPNSITTISYEAFKYCNELTTVVVGSGITTIGESNVGYSFGSCPKLRDFYIYPNNIPTTLDRTFDETSLDNVILHVPANLVDVYKSTAPWSGFKEIIALTDSDPKPDDQQNVINGHEYVDLGLPSGKLWAKTNYGASSEGDYGIYMDWSSRNSIQSVWGSEWTTPSHSDILELYQTCTFTWEYNANSIFGCKVTGPNGKFIFLPAAGFKILGTPQMVGTDIYYWSDNEYESGFAYALQGSAESGISVYQTWNIEYAMFSIRPVANKKDSSSEEETHDFVDLALPSGLLWATSNVGSNHPEDHGSYFAWGETSPKNEYNWSTYIYANGAETTLTKYCNSSSYGNVDYKEVLEEGDDAATVNWGKPWRTPTLSETQELINYCSWVLTTQNGISGYKVTGVNGNSIFIPAGGVMQYNGSYFTDRSVVMSATTFQYCTSACVLCCKDGAPQYWYGWDRCWGYNVRPVMSVDPSGITTLSNDSSQEIIGVYDLRGNKHDDFVRGINIIKYKNGSSKKLVK